MPDRLKSGSPLATITPIIKEVSLGFRLQPATPIALLVFFVANKSMLNRVLVAIIIILAVLWFLGYAPISGINIPEITLFSINNQPITLWNILILAAIGWAISVLPSPFRQIAFVILVLWALSTLGILAISGLPSILVIAIIVGLLIFMFKGA